jgi:hypothetical protein
MKVLFISLTCGLLLAACGGPMPEESVNVSEPVLSSSEQPICEGWDSGARHCTYKCTSTDFWHWYSYNQVPYGQCRDWANAACGRTAYAVCWSKS